MQIIADFAAEHNKATRVQRRAGMCEKKKVLSPLQQPPRPSPPTPYLIPEQVLRTTQDSRKPLTFP